MRALNVVERQIYNVGERMIPGVTHGPMEWIRHSASYKFFREVIEFDMRERRPGDPVVRVADLGCGVGHGCLEIASIDGCVVTGIDISATVIEYARKNYSHPSVDYVQADLREFVESMDEFDYVVSRGVLEHIPNGIGLAQRSRWTKRLLIDVPYRESEGNPHHVMHQITEIDFANFQNAELFLEDLCGVIYPLETAPRSSNMIACVASREGLLRVTESLAFPRGATAWFSREQLFETAARFIEPTEVVLDIGCGLRPQTFFHPRVHLCCEPHGEYSEVLKRWSQFTVFKSTAKELLPKLVDQSVDSVFLLDVIEHIDKEEGRALLKQCERIARRQIVLFTPLGFVEQEYENDDATDAWGLHGGRWQTHRSGWVPEDFDATWSIIGCRDYHSVNGKGEPRVPPNGAFWAVKTFGDGNLSRAKSRPRLAVILPNALACSRIGLELCAALREELEDFCLVTSASGGYRDIARFHGRLPTLPKQLELIVATVPEMPTLPHYVPRQLAGMIRVWQYTNLNTQSIAKTLQDVGCETVFAISGDIYQFPAACNAAKSLGLRLITGIDLAAMREMRSSPGMLTTRYLHRRAKGKADRTIQLDAGRPLSAINEENEVLPLVKQIVSQLQSLVIQP